jgi:hypothetical protein
VAAERDRFRIARLPRLHVLETICCPTARDLHLHETIWFPTASGISSYRQNYFLRCGGVYGIVWPMVSLVANGQCIFDAAGSMVSYGL